MRFTLGKMFLAIGMLALACAGMTNCHRWWAHGIFIFTVLMYAFVAIQAIVSQGKLRAVSAVYAIVGGSYLLLSVCRAFFPFVDLVLTNQVLIKVGTELELPPPAVRVDWLDTKGEWQQFIGPADEVEEIVPQSALKKIAKPHERIWPQAFNPSEILHTHRAERAFLVIGHCVFSWIFAVMAACFAGRMWDRRERPPKEAT